jgi:hypothetical protein
VQKSLLSRTREGFRVDYSPETGGSDGTIEHVTNDILALLITERDRFNRAIEALQGARRRGRPPKSEANPIPEIKPRRQRKGMSAAARKAHSARMKKYWAAKRKATA